MSEIDLQTVQQLEHQTYQITLKYAHLSPEHRQSAVDILVRKTGILGARRIEHGTNLAQTEKSPFLENTETLVVQ